jgi:hypothetical protein
VSHLDLAVDTALNYHALVRPGRVLTGPQHRIAASLAAATAAHYEALVAAAPGAAAVRMWTTAANKAHDTAARHELAAHLISCLSARCPASGRKDHTRGHPRTAVQPKVVHAPGR